MASESEVLRLRRVTDLMGNQDPYSDELLSALIDEFGFEKAAATIWHEKAASYATLVDTTESGSTRRLSQLHDHALKIAGSWSPPVEEETAGGTSFTVAIERM
jgi:hypothetical protein